MEAADVDVLVVGAGPVGLTLATELARAGVTHRLIDKAPEPNPLSRAAGIQSRTLELLDRSGIVEPFLDEGLAIPRGEISMGGRVRATIDLSELDVRYPYILDIPQARTEEILTDHLRSLGGDVDRNVALTDLAQDATGADVTVVRDGGATEQLRCRWVVGCDGGHSTVRDLAPTRLKGSFKGQRVLLADARCDWDVEWPVMRMSLTRHGMAGSFPFRGDRVRFFAQLGDQFADGEPTLDGTQAVLAELLSPTLRLTEAIWLTVIELHHGQVPGYRFGRVLLAGDAAHIHSPAGGQGMNTGMQDAWNLAWKLALVCGGAGEGLLDSYDAERHPVGARVVSLTTRAARLATLRAPGLGHLRNTLVGTMTGHASVRHRFEAGLAEVDIAYPHSPIVGEHVEHRSHGRHAGDAALADPVEPGNRVPEVDGLTDGSGGPATLWSSLRPGRHTALLVVPHEGPDADGDVSFDVEQNAAAIVAAMGDLGEVVLVTSVASATGSDLDVLVDPSGHVAAALGLHAPALVVVRPDSYVGYVAAPPEAEALAHYRRDLLDLPDR